MSVSTADTPTKIQNTFLVVLRVLSVLLWAALMVLATTGARLIGEAFDLGQFATDSIGGGAWLLIALICRFESRTWWSFLLALIPFYGYIHSLRCFWRLPAPATENHSLPNGAPPTLGP